MPQSLFNFASPEAQTALGVLVAAYWISEGFVALCLSARQKDRIDDRGSSRLLQIVILLAWWIGFVLAWVPHASFGSAPVLCAGLIVMIAGQLLRWWSVATLGGLFTVNVAIRAGHRLIESGPYRYVRHPAYTAVLLVHLGTGCAWATP